MTLSRKDRAESSQPALQDVSGGGVWWFHSTHEVTEWLSVPSEGRCVKGERELREGTTIVSDVQGYL